MRITLQNLGKRYRKAWIFEKLNYQFLEGQGYALRGHNGSGKSTLMQILSAHLSPSTGTIEFVHAHQHLQPGQVYAHLSYTAPYIELIQEFTLKEILLFQARFKPFRQGLSARQVFELLELPKRNIHQEIKFLSSGMQQRLKLALAILADTPLLLLDEPTITLDAQGIQWYQSLLQAHCDAQRLWIIASNVEHDYINCAHTLNILNYKNINYK